jgi:hypothetical protein
VAMHSGCNSMIRTAGITTFPGQATLLGSFSQVSFLKYFHRKLFHHCLKSTYSPIAVMIGKLNNDVAQHSRDHPIPIAL